jgi:hypothetical protein
VRLNEPKENDVPEVVVGEETLVKLRVASAPSRSLKFTLELPLLEQVPPLKHPDVVNVYESANTLGANAKTNSINRIDRRARIATTPSVDTLFEFLLLSSLIILATVAIACIHHLCAMQRMP